MKSVFEVVLIIFITLTMFMSMVFFTDEVAISQRAVQIRNEVITQIEIDGGYTDSVKEDITTRLNKLDNDIKVEVSKEGKLEYGEQIEIIVSIIYQRKIPFLNMNQNVIYQSKGVFYNVLP